MPLDARFVIHLQEVVTVRACISLSSANFATNGNLPTGCLELTAQLRSLSK
jgi:hypothetical protein